MRVVPSALLLLAAGLALGPVAAAHAAERRLYLPGAAVADPDGALSLDVNPAGLAEVAGGEVRLQAAYGGARFGGHRGAGWGLYGDLPLGPLAVAGALQHDADGLPGADQPDWHEIQRASLGLGLALGERAFVGLATHAQDRTSRDDQTVDLGLLLRPWRWLSLGARLTGLRGEDDVRPLGAPDSRWAWGVAVRPLASDRVTATFDLDLPADRALPRQGASRAWAATVSARVYRGLRALVEYRDFRPEGGGEREQRLGLLLRLGFGTSGVDLAGHRDKDASGKDLGLAVGLRLGAATGESLLAEGDRAVSLRLDGELTEHVGGDGQHFTHLLLTLDRIRRAPATEVVLLQAADLRANWAQVQELRSAIASLRAAGKVVIWSSDGLGTRALAVAAACNLIVMPPGGALSARGVGADFVGLKDTLARVGVTVQTLRYGAWKSAAEQLDHSQPSPELAATLQHVVDKQWQMFVDAVALGRDLTPTAVESALAAGAVYPEDAQRAKLIDAVVPSAELEDWARERRLLGAGERFRLFDAPARQRRQWGARPRIAVVEIEGNIADRVGGMSPLGRTIGGLEIARAIRQAGEDGDTAAIVARIDSPGGAVHGSDLMSAALRKAGEKKPVLASMGGVAASGGYWTSLGAQTVYASPGTVTGSIGIITLKPSLQGLLGKLDLGLRHFGAGPHSDVTTLKRPWTEDEAALLHRVLGRYYTLFLTRTGERRGIDRAALLELAEGRIWFGDEAQARRLVDREGGILDALADARRQTGLSEADDLRYDFLPRPSLLDKVRRRLGVGGAAVADPGLAAFVAAMREAAGPWLDTALLVQAYGAHRPLALEAAPLGRREP